MRRFFLQAACGAFLLLFSGCVGEPGTVAETTEVVVVTDPADRTMLEDPGAHLHDYWGDATTRTVIDSSQEVANLWRGPPIAVAEFRPEPGTVVPLGTGWVNVTLSWVDEPDAAYGQTSLWVRTAADHAPHQVAAVRSGDTVPLRVTNEMDDLPHQVLSAWRVELRAAPPDDVRFLRFHAVVKLKAEASKTLDIPLFPSHPNPWSGLSKLQLLDADAEAPLYQGPGGSGNCFFGCFRVHAPRNGSIVPYDATLVRATWDVDAPATPADLQFHPADDWAFKTLQPVATQGTKRVYEIPVGGTMADGPYAIQSQWEFRMNPTGPMGFFRGSYHLALETERA